MHYHLPLFFVTRPLCPESHVLARCRSLSHHVRDRLESNRFGKMVKGYPDIVKQRLATACTRHYPPNSDSTRVIYRGVRARCVYLVMVEGSRNGRFVALLGKDGPLLYLLMSLSELLRLDEL